jgi:CheY-like chemotaxis protein
VEERILVHKRRILIMDDQVAIRELLGQILSYSGYDTAAAGDGTEAIELYRKAKEEGVPFDIVIMDLTIPGGMGGKEAIKKLMEIDSNVKAIVSSGYSNDPIMSDYKKYGFWGVVVKPYKAEELNEILRSIMAEENQ